MRSFQALSLAFTAAALAPSAYSQYLGSYGLGIGGLSYGGSYGGYAPASYSSRVSTIAAPAAISYSAPAYASRVSTISPGAAYSYAAPATTVAYSAAPAVSYAAAPAVGYAVAAPAVSYSAGGYGGSYGGYGAGIGGAQVVSSGAPAIQSHEIHTGGNSRRIHVEEYKGPSQLIRVHDTPQQGPEVHNVQGPGAPSAHIRLIARDGPTQVTRSIQQDHNVQVFDVANPPPARDQIVNIRGQPAGPAQVELAAQTETTAPEITLDLDDRRAQVVHAGGAASYSTGASFAAAAPAYTTAVHAAPAVAVHAAPAATYTAVHAAPAIAVQAAPVASYATRVHTIAAPAASYAVAAPVASYSLGHSYAAPAATYSLGQSYSSPAISYGYGSGYGASYGSYGYGSSGLGKTVVVGKKAKKA